MDSVKIFRNGSNLEISSKDLYAALEIKEEYEKWLLNTVMNNLTEGTDYRKRERKLNEYRLTLPAAKKVAMLAMTDIGSKISLYISEQIQSAKEKDEILSLQLEQANKDIEKLKKQITKLKEEIANNKEKVAYYDAVAKADGTISIQQLSVFLTQNGFKIGEKPLYELLREDGFLCKNPLNSPTKKSLDQGYMVYQERLYPADDRKGYKLAYSPRLTNRGKQFFLKYYLHKAKLFTCNYDEYDNFVDDEI